MLDKVKHYISGLRKPKRLYVVVTAAVIGAMLLNMFGPTSIYITTGNHALVLPRISVDSGGYLCIGVSDIEVRVGDRYAYAAGEGDILIAREATGGQQLEGTTWSDVTWDTTTREDNSATIDHTANNSEIYLKQVGHYLVIYNVAASDDAGNGRRQLWTQLEINDAAINYGFSAMYIRDTDSCTDGNAWAATIVYNDNASNRLEVACRDQSQTIATDVRAGNSGIQVLRLDDSWDYLRLYTTDSINCGQDGLWDDVTWSNEDEDDLNAHTASSASITIQETGRYLVTYNCHWEEGTVRQSAESRLVLDGTEIDGTRTQAYMRNASTDIGAANYAGILYFDQNDVVKLQGRNATEGTGSSSDVTINGPTSLTMLKLNDDADYCRLGRITSDVTATDNKDMEWNEELEDDADFNFDGSPADQIDINTTADYLVLATPFIYKSSGADRDPFEHYVAIDGTPVTYGSSQDYIRGRHSGEECVSYGRSLGIMGSISSGSYIEIHAEQMGDGIAENTSWKVDRCAFQAVNIDDLFVACSEDITNSPGSKAFGTVSASTSHWSNGSAPTFPLDDGECYFTVTNNSGGAVDIDIKATNFTGGTGWTLAGTPGADTVTLKAGKSGDATEGAMVTLTTTDQSFISALADSASKKWELKMETPTSYSDGAAKSSTVTITASCS